MLLISCDPGYDDYVCLQNHSGLDFTFKSLDSNNYYANTITVPKDSCVVIGSDGGMGSTNKEQNEWLARRIYGDSMMISFNDGHYVKYYANKDTVGSPYDMKQGSSYEYIKKTNKRNHDYEGRLIYTVTKSNYDDAVASK